MSDRINIGYLKEDVSHLESVILTSSEVLALVEAVEAAHRMHTGWAAGEGAFDWNDLADALARFDFRDDA